MRPALTRLSRSAAVALLLLGVPALSSAASKETERVEKTVTFSPGGTLKLKTSRATSRSPRRSGRHLARRGPPPAIGSTM